jgi:hypothetical protein
MLTSIPTSQPQPDAPFYPADVLKLFRSFTRQSYKDAAGIDAPTGDPTKRPKYWFDSSLVGRDPDEIVTYSFIDRGRANAVRKMMMTVAEARSVNIPGIHSYPDYVVAPTSAYAFGPGNDGVPIRLAGLNADILSTRKQAEDLAKAWGVDPSTVVDEAAFGGPIQYVFPVEENRRKWGVPFNGVHRNVGTFLKEMYANGVGNPGKWDLTGPEPNWISSVPTVQNFDLPPWDEPVRDLLTNEAFAPPNLFGGVVVYRKDRESIYNPTNTSAPGVVTAGGSGLTQSQASDLAFCVRALKAILQAAGLQL